MGLTLQRSWRLSLRCYVSQYIRVLAYELKLPVSKAGKFVEEAGTAKPE
jgi:hypothetical protein